MADIKISELSSAAVVNGVDVFPMTASGVTVKAPASKIKDYVIGTTDNSALGADVSAQIATLNTNVGKCEVLVVNVASFNSLPQTVTNTDIESDMVVLNSVLGTPSVQTGDWTVTTSAGSLTIAGTISGSTTLTLYLAKSR